MAENIFPFAIFFPHAEVNTTTNLSPASHSFGRSNPHSGVILFPRIRHHRARAPASTVHPADDLCRYR
jgi:hypothetical protein